LTIGNANDRRSPPAWRIGHDLKSWAGGSSMRVRVLVGESAFAMVLFWFGSACRERTAKRENDRVRQTPEAGLIWK